MVINMNESKAPILITVLNRYEHFKRCIESLENCKEAKDSNLYVALDYPPSIEYEEGYQKIKHYLKKAKLRFNKVTVIERGVNFGAWKNYIKSIEYVLKIHEKIIVTEDDNVFSEDFLNYINLGLNKYADNDDVFSINGYMYPCNFKKSFENETVLAYQGFSAWGYGIWKSKFEKLNFDLIELRKFLSDKDNVNKVLNEKSLKNMYRMLDENRLIGDTYMYYFQVRNSMFSIFPDESKVRNLGHDGTGINCSYDRSANNIYSKQIFSKQETNLNDFPKYITINTKHERYINKFLNPNRFYIALKKPDFVISYLKNKFKRGWK